MNLTASNVDVCRKQDFQRVCERACVYVCVFIMPIGNCQQRLPKELPKQKMALFVWPGPCSYCIAGIEPGKKSANFVHIKVASFTVNVWKRSVLSAGLSLWWIYIIIPG